MSFYEVVEKYRDFDFDGYFENVTDNDVLRSLNKDKLNHMDVLNLLSPKAMKYLEQMAQKAHRLSLQHLGKTVTLYTPMYIATYCVNHCVYCGYNCKSGINRRKLNMEQIKNDQLTVEISAHGAELKSIKDANGNEYLWDGDEKYWNRHSPILFPIVCGLWKDTYRTEGKEYHLPRHGFARDTEFKLVGKTADRLTFALIDNEETQKNYPYHFNLAISYRLQGNEIHVIWHVENTDDKEIFFQIGGHPAFMVPGCKKGEEMKATLKLDNEAPVRLYGNVGGCIDRQAKETVETDKGIWEVNEETFAEDAVIFDKSQVKQVSILNEQGEPNVTLEFKTPAVGIWNPTGKHAPFLCIEPWYGLSDWAEYDGEFKDKYLMNRLQPGASFMSEYIIRIEK